MDLPDLFTPFEVYVMQSGKVYSVSEFYRAVREFEAKDTVLNMVEMRKSKDFICFYCKKKGHIKS